MKRFAFAFASVALVACNNPASDKPQATVAAPLATASAAPAAATTYAISPAGSKVEWTGSKVTGSHDGSFTSFTGSIALPAEGVEKGQVKIDIDSASLTTSPEKLLGHLKSPDFFDVAKYPKVSFVSTSIKAGADKNAAYTVVGNLELHGVSKSISFPAVITTAPDAVDAKATFSINRKDFGLNYPGKADDLIRDDVVVKLTIHAPAAKK